MTQYVFFTAFILFVSFAFSRYSHAWEVWAKTPLHIQKALSFKIPGLTHGLIKTAVFHKSGKAKFIFNQKEWEKTCKANIQHEAWVTHCLSSGEELSPSAGILLGKQLNRGLKNSCVYAIELDIEPLSTLSPWLIAFLKNVKKQTSPKLELRIAIPPCSSSPIPGLFWTTDNAHKLLKVLDGLDLMLYDTGLKTIREYQTLIHQNLVFAKKALSIFPKKTILLGFPAYKDKTQKHALNIENLETVFKTLSSLAPDQAKFLCQKDVRFSYYASWTIDSKDRIAIKRITKWREQLCQK